MDTDFKTEEKRFRQDYRINTIQRSEFNSVSSSSRYPLKNSSLAFAF